jgi:hypothetical protein
LKALEFIPVWLKRRLQAASHKRASASSLQIDVRRASYNKAHDYAAFFCSLVGPVHQYNIAALLP